MLVVGSVSRVPAGDRDKGVDRDEACSNVAHGSDLLCKIAIDGWAQEQYTLQGSEKAAVC